MVPIYRIQIASPDPAAPVAAGNGDNRYEGSTTMLLNTKYYVCLKFCTFRRIRILAATDRRGILVNT